MTTPARAIAAGQSAIKAFLEAQAAFRSRRADMLVAARGLLAARELNWDNRTFGRWLRSSAYRSLNKNERACLISIARNEQKLGAILNTTNISSPVALWRRARRSLGIARAA